MHVTAGEFNHGQREHSVGNHVGQVGGNHEQIRFWLRVHFRSFVKTCKTFSLNCRSAQCLLDCNTDVIVKDCGRATLDLMIDLTNHTLASSGRLLTSMGMIEDLPEHCKAFASISTSFTGGSPGLSFYSKLQFFKINLVNYFWIVSFFCFRLKKTPFFRTCF
jgi:hypothetical protein